MIASIFGTSNGGQEGDSADLPSAATGQFGLTRSSFLRAVTAGVIVAGAGTAFAANRKKIAPVTDVNKLYDAWQERFNAADIDGMVDLYVADVFYINPDGKELIGHAGVRADFGGLFALKPRIDLHDRKHIVYRDIVLTTNHWTMDFVGADGVAQKLKGGGIEVLRKQSDGGWRFIIDDASRSAS